MSHFRLQAADSRTVRDDKRADCIVAKKVVNAVMDSSAGYFFKVAT